MITVTTFLWSDPDRRRDYSFRHDHVRTLKNMVARNLTIPHRFVCITDDAIEGVDTVQIDWRTHVPGTCGIKLMVWRPDIGDVLGERILMLDLDMVIVSNIDSLIGDDDVRLFRNPNYTEGGRRAFYQGSIQLLNAGARPHVWANIFKPWAPNVVNSRFGGFEQAWLSEMLPWDEAHWTDEDGIYGAGRLGGAGIYDELPQNAKIVVFPGNREPSQAEMKQKYPWIDKCYR